MKIQASSKTPLGETLVVELNLPDSLVVLSAMFGEPLLLSLLNRGIQQKISRPLQRLAKNSRTQEEVDLYFSAYSKTLSQPGRLVKVQSVEIEEELKKLDLTNL